MCDSFRDNEWKPLPMLNDNEKKILQMALNAASSQYVCYELDAETDDERDYYLNREEEVKALRNKIFGTAPTEHKPQKEKQLRPFKNSREFILLTGLDVGHVFYFRFRAKNSEHIIPAKVIIVSLVDNSDNTTSVNIGGSVYTLESLFKDYEYYPNSNLGWKPFGVYE